ncbi:hypothetical protein BFP72_13680 [Reichenbachiella sp. 5M10]|nr:hypothetical protein BFP72_13680 [Reichenbachiella sp. 5M10]
MDRALPRKKQFKKEIIFLMLGLIVGGVGLYHFVFTEREVKLRVQKDKVRIVRVMRAEQRLAPVSRPDRLMVPRGNFGNSHGGQWVFVVTGDEAVRREIKLGCRGARYIEVLEGLEAGEEIVVSSYAKYSDKDRLVFR